MYAEQGGQEYDTGSITVDGKAEFVVENVQVYGGYVLHTGYLKYGVLQVDDELRRWPIRNNHTGTHLLNYALREILSNGVDQKGSLVAPEKLRFDFTSKTGMTPQQIHEADSIVTDFIKRGLAVYSQEVTLTTAKQITGLCAVFGEVYPDPVRVVSIGFDVNDILKDVLGKELDEIVISAYKKSVFKERFAGIKKAFDDADKARKAKQVKDVVDQCKQFFERNPEAKVFVALLDVGSNARAIAAVTTHVKTQLKDKAAYVFSVDESSNKVSHACVVGQTLLD
ncbi:Alanine--tRNA ligase, partial [Mortierella sp. NVP85]